MNTIAVDADYEEAIQTVALDTDVVSEATALAARLARPDMRQFKPWENASEGEIAAYAAEWVIAKMVYDLYLDHSRMWRLRHDHDAFMAEAARVAARKKRRAGVTALERKYGHTIAAKIVYRHSGRRIQ